MYLTFIPFGRNIKDEAGSLAYFGHRPNQLEPHKNSNASSLFHKSKLYDIRVRKIKRHCEQLEITLQI